MIPDHLRSSCDVGYAALVSEWVTSTLTFAEWHASLGASNPRPYTELVSHFTMHVDNNQLAFVRADATLMRNGEARSHNIDYFSLIRHGGYA